MPDFIDHSLTGSVDSLQSILPEQGSIELQNDQSKKIHDWHYHNVDEELFLMAGDLVLFWSEHGTRNERTCSAGEMIKLPAGTVHGSVAGEAGAVYIIRPVSGVSATTNFLSKRDNPHSVAALVDTSDAAAIP